MNTSYRVCIIVPQGYVHAGCFVETAIALKCGLNDLGFECDLKANELHPDRVNILLGYHLIAGPESLAGARYIPYQLEQLSDASGGLSEKNRAILLGALAVWDFSRENVDYLAALGIAAGWLPPGYHVALERIVPAGDRDIDVLFYGSLGGRRAPLLEKLKARTDLSCHCLFGVYGKERDAMIARSKIVLNVHYYAAALFESVRVSYLLNNGSFVVSEESASFPYTRVPLSFAPFDRLEERIDFYLANTIERAQTREQCRKSFCDNYSMQSLLSPLVTSI